MNKEKRNAFNFQKLVNTFTEICPDFCQEPDYSKPTVSRRFSEQVIFEYSKQAKKAKSLGKDQKWTIVLNSRDDKGNVIKYDVIISFNQNKEMPEVQPIVVHGALELTFKQASLLAVEKYCQLVPHLVMRNNIVLTPLAGAVYSVDKIRELASALDESLPVTIMAVISSCQTSGYHLRHSRCYMAVAALVTTVANLELRASLVKAEIRRYKLHGKEFDMPKFEICCRFFQSAGNSKNASKTNIDNLVTDIINIGNSSIGMK